MPCSVIPSFEGTDGEGTELVTKLFQQKPNTWSTLNVTGPSSACKDAVDCLPCTLNWQTVLPPLSSSLTSCRRLPDGADAFVKVAWSPLAVCARTPTVVTKKASTASASLGKLKDHIRRGFSHSNPPQS